MDFEIIKAGFCDSRFLFKCVDGKETHNRKLSHYEIELFTEDGGTAYINNIPHEIKKGCVLVSKPRQLRHSRLHFRTHYIHLKTEHPLLCTALNNLPDFYELTDVEEARKTLLKMIQIYEDDFSEKHLYMHSKMYEFIHLLNRDANRAMRIGQSYDKNSILKAKEYIERHFAEPINLESIAAAANLSPVYFHKLFKGFTGKTPHDYLLDVRMSVAKNMLILTHTHIQEIAFSCGFSSQSYFNACFRKKTGMSPLQYRNKELNKYQNK